MFKDFDNQYKNYFSALIHGERRNCHDIVDRVKNNVDSISDLYTQLFQKSLYEIGQLWEFNKISVAVEHVATAITESLMNNVYADIEQSSNTGLRVIIANAPNEYHQIGAKMVADIFELNGWNTWYLGANTPTSELIRLANDIQPHVIGLSLSVYFHLSDLATMIHTINKNIPGCPVIIGGQSFKHGNGADFANQFSDVSYIDSLDSLEQFIKNFNRNGKLS
jgi:methanogenic corrinoid protein MtbC1